MQNMKKTAIFLAVILLVAVIVLNNNKSESVTVNASRVLTRDIEISVTTSGYTVPKTDGDYTDVYVVLSVNENDISKVAEGNRAELTLVAVPDKIFNGHVSEISPYANRISGIKSTTGYIDVKVEFDGNYSEIKPGYSVDAKIYGESVKNALLVPYDAVVTKNGDDCVWVLENGEVNLKKVQTGIEEDFNTQITSGLSGEETVILNPPWQGTDAVKVKQTEAVQ